MPTRPKQSKLTEKQRAFINAYLETKSPSKAATLAGYKVPDVQGSQLLDPNRFPLVAAECSRRLAEQEKRSAKKADDILRYIHTAMYFNPARWFEANDEGWFISEENYRSLPDEIGQLIENITKRVVEVEFNGSVRKEVWFKVELVSKTAAMALAAKHQLGEKMNVIHTTVNWDDMLLARRPDPGDDPIEAEILSVRGNVPAIEAPKGETK